jgi:ABC-type phosphate transport system auxiliary subunit
VGLAGVVMAVALASVTPIALLGLVVAVVAWRGCPTCWAVGLAQTREQRDACRAGGRCR